jgi:hypothetical protein
MTDSTYSWNLANAHFSEINASNSVLTQIDWNYVATRGAISTLTPGTAAFDPPQILDNANTDVQQAVVVGWIVTQIGTFYIANMESMMDARLDKIEAAANTTVVANPFGSPPAP